MMDVQKQYGSVFVCSHDPSKEGGGLFEVINHDREWKMSRDFLNVLYIRANRALHLPLYLRWLSTMNELIGRYPNYTDAVPFLAMSSDISYPIIFRFTDDSIDASIFFSYIYNFWLSYTSGLYISGRDPRFASPCHRLQTLIRDHYRQLAKIVRLPLMVNLLKELLEVPLELLTLATEYNIYLKITSWKDCVEFGKEGSDRAFLLSVFPHLACLLVIPEFLTFFFHVTKFIRNDNYTLSSVFSWIYDMFLPNLEDKILLSVVV